MAVKAFPIVDVINFINEGYAGPDQKGSWSPDMLKKPDRDNVLRLYVSLVQQNLANVQANLPANLVTFIDHPTLYSDDTMFKASLVRAVKKLFASFKIELPESYGGEFSLSDVLFPKPKRFIFVTSQLLNLSFEIDKFVAAVEDVNEKFKEQQAERDDLISEIERKQK